MIHVMTSPTRKRTAEDLRALYGEDSRYELIHGELVEKAMPRTEHAANQASVLTSVARRFHRQAGGKWPGGWWILPELHVGYADDEVFCHDLCGFRRDKHAELPKQWPCRLVPDWVCELLSPGREKRDRVDKWQVLFRAGVPHYWIVNPEEKFLEVYRWTAHGYEATLKAGGGDVIRAEPFGAVELRTSVLFGDEDDDD